jgi:hypothetical protein
MIERASATEPAATVLNHGRFPSAMRETPLA